MKPDQPRWRPRTEAEAAATSTLFHEWARAGGAEPPGLDNAQTLRQWALAHPATLVAFAGLSPVLSFRANLLRHAGPRTALIDGERTWSRDALRQEAELPVRLAIVLGQGGWPDLLALAAHHLLVADTRPDDVVPWSGDPLPLGAWLVGATVECAA